MCVIVCHLLVLRLVNTVNLLVLVMVCVLLVVVLLSLVLWLLFGVVCCDGCCHLLFTIDVDIVIGVIVIMRVIVIGVTVCYG